MDKPSPPSSSPMQSTQAPDLNPLAKQHETDKSSASIKVVTPTKNIPVPSSDPVKNAKLSERNLSKLDDSISFNTESTNLLNQNIKETLPDGSFFIEASDNPEHAAKTATKKIKESHGQGAANAAKAFFGAVLNFIAEHKNEILCTVGFGLITAGIVGGIACPAVFVLMAPGMMFLTFGFSSLTDPSVTPSPGPKPEPNPDPKPEPTPSLQPKPNLKKTDDEQKETEETKPAPQPTVTNTTTPDSKKMKPTEEERPINIPTPPPPPPLPTINPSTLNSHKNTDKTCVSMHAELSEKFQKIPGFGLVSRNASKKECDEAFKKVALEMGMVENSDTEKLKVIDIDLEKEIQQLTKEQQAKIYKKYSKVAVGYDLMQQKKQREDIPTAVLCNTLNKERLVLETAFKKKALTYAIDAIKNGKPYTSAEMASHAVKELKPLIDQLHYDMRTDPEKNKVENQKLKEDVEQFFNDYANSL